MLCETSFSRRVRARAAQQRPVQHAEGRIVREVEMEEQPRLVFCTIEYTSRFVGRGMQCLRVVAERCRW